MDGSISLVFFNHGACVGALLMVRGGLCLWEKRRRGSKPDPPLQPPAVRCIFWVGFLLGVTVEICVVLVGISELLISRLVAS